MNSAFSPPDFMEIGSENLTASGLRFIVYAGGEEAGWASLYIFPNPARGRPYGLLADVFIREAFRGRGLGTRLVQAVIAAAKAAGCYKLFATSRHERTKVHALYGRLGFKDWGREFRIDFE